MSAVGSYYSDRNLQLFAFLMLALAVLVVAIKPRMPDVDQDRFFMAVIVCVSLSLLLSTTLLSDNLVGWDIHQEYSIFSQVLRNGVWHPTIDLPYNSVLSVSLLPAILSVVSGLDGLLIFRIVFPLLFSTVPLFLYKLYRQFLNPRAAFLSAFLFMSYPTFYVELPALARQQIAEIFLVLVLWFVFSRKVRQEQSTTSFVVLALTVGLITAHYSIAFIYIYHLGIIVSSIQVCFAKRCVTALCDKTRDDCNDCINYRSLVCLCYQRIRLDSSNVNSFGRFSWRGERFPQSILEAPHCISGLRLLCASWTFA